MNNKALTLMFAMGFSIGNFIIWVYLFSAFLFGYTVTFLEPNIIIASAELVAAMVCIPIVFKTFKERIIQNE